MSRTEPTRLPELMSHERAALDLLLDSTIVGHVGVVGEDGRPVVLPTAVARWGDLLLAHGSTGSRWMRLVVGSPVAVSIAAVDGIIVARSTFESSLAYRSAVVFGTFGVLGGEEKHAALDVLTDRLIPGRRAEVRASTKKELASTLVLAMPIEEWSLRISQGWADDADEDSAGPAWSGQVAFGDRPIAVHVAPDLHEGIPIPASVRSIRARH